MDELDKEDLGSYLRRVENGRVDLEPFGAYLHSASKARRRRLNKVSAAILRMRHIALTNMC